MHIETERFSALGGLEDPEVRRILDNFASSLPGHLVLLESLKDKRGSKELAMALHKLNGTAKSCGFVAVGNAAEAWSDAPDSEGDAYFTRLTAVVNASIEEWHLVMDAFKTA